MSLYPTLEDLKVTEMAQAQHHQGQGGATNAMYPPQPGSQVAAYQQPSSSTLYPSLASYMGMDLAQVTANDPSACHPSAGMIAPVSGQQGALGIMKSEIKPGLRKVTVCKDKDGKVGLTLKGVDNGLFVSVVHANTPAALAGIRFGDQILEIGGKLVAGWSNKDACKAIKKMPTNDIEVVLRDRPFERTLTLHKDSAGYCGFLYKGGRISSIVKDSSAARNGLLIDQQLVEVDGRNVVAMTDKDIGKVIERAPQTVTITVMPRVLYEHMIKCIGSSTLRKDMDHSVPEM